MSSKQPKAQTAAHFVLQGKGGVGKSLIAAVLAQYFKEEKREVKCYDTDPVNSTLARYEALKATHLPLMVEGDIDRRKFDTLMEDILSSQGVTFVVDNGASTFIPLGHYMAENNVLELLQSSGAEVVTHCVVTGGQALQDTLAGFDAMARIAPPKGIVVWVNEYFGPVEHAGIAFPQMDVLKNHADKVRGVVTLQKRNADTFGADVRDMVGKYMTFDEAIGSDKVALMAKQRLKMVKAEVFSQLKEIGL
jgi:hypothetical protein